MDRTFKKRNQIFTWDLWNQSRRIPQSQKNARGKIQLTLHNTIYCLPPFPTTSPYRECVSAVLTALRDLLPVSYQYRNHNINRPANPSSTKNNQQFRPQKDISKQERPLPQPRHGTVRKKEKEKRQLNKSTRSSTSSSRYPVTSTVGHRGNTLVVLETYPRTLWKQFENQRAIHQWKRTTHASINQIDWFLGDRSLEAFHAYTKEKEIHTIHQPASISKQ